MAQAMADGYLRYLIVTDVYGPMNLSHVYDIFSLLYLHKIPASAEKICGRRVFCRKLFLVEFECLRYNEPIEFFCFGKDRDSIPDEAEV